MSTCSCNCSEIENPPTKGNMGIFQIIELAVMILAGVLCVMDLVDSIGNKRFTTVWLILIIAMDACVVVGVVFIFIGLFCSAGSGKIKMGIILFFIGALIAIVFICYNLFHAFSIENFLLELVKGAILVFLAIILWKQSSKLA